MMALVKKNYKKVLASLMLVMALGFGGCTINIEGLGDLDDFVIDIFGVCGECGCGGCGDYYEIEIDD
jgi:hypothetical protein